MKMDDARARRLVVAAAAVALVVRLLFGLVYWVNQPLTHDEHEYLALARGLASGAGFVYDDAIETGTAQQFGRAPGYPAFLAALDAGRPVPATAPTRVKVAQSILGAIIVAMIGLLAYQASGPRAAIVAATLASFYPSLVWTPAYVLSETLFSVVALGLAFVLQKAVDEDEPKQAPRADGLASALTAGVLAGVGALIRPAILFFFPLAVLWLLFRRRLRLAIAFAVAAAIVITPWTLRNLRVYDRLIVIASEGGVTFWTGNHPLARGEGDLAANPSLKQADLDFRSAHPGMSAEELEPQYYRSALSWIASHPLDWLVLLARKTFYTIVPVGPSYALHSARYRVASAVPYLLVLPFAVLGARRLWRSPRRPTALFLLAAGSFLMCLVFFPQERFRIPVIDPVLIVCAAALADRKYS